MTLELIYESMIKQFYHVAYATDLKSIRKNGLIATPDYILSGVDDRPGVNLTTSLENVPGYNKNSKRFVVIKVDMAKLDPKKLISFGTEDTWWYRYLGNIPPGTIGE